MVAAIIGHWPIFWIKMVIRLSSGIEIRRDMLEIGRKMTGRHHEFPVVLLNAIKIWDVSGEMAVSSVTVGMVQMVIIRLNPIRSILFPTTLCSYGILQIDPHHCNYRSIMRRNTPHHRVHYTAGILLPVLALFHFVVVTCKYIPTFISDLLFVK